MPTSVAAKAQLSLNNKPDPTVIFETLTRYQQTMALKGAFELGLFTHVIDGAATPSKLATVVGAPERSVRILCEFLTATGFLIKANGQFTVPQHLAPFVNRNSPAYMGGIAAFLASEDNRKRFDDVAGLVRRGGSTDGGLTDDVERWVLFAKTMTPIVNMLAGTVAEKLCSVPDMLKVLDVAAGSGAFGIAIAKRNPLATVVANDSVDVLAVARSNAERAGILERYQTLLGDIFNIEIGTGYDLVLLPNILPHFDAVRIVNLLAKLRASIKTSGRIATIAFIPNEDRVSPPIPASFGLVMLANTTSGDVYTFNELSAMFREAGFGKSTLHDLSPAPQRLVLTEY